MRLLSCDWDAERVGTALRSPGSSCFGLAPPFPGSPDGLLLLSRCGEAGRQVREVIDDGIDGRLVPEGDAEALANVLEDLLRNPEASARIASMARRVAIERHSRELMNARYEALFLELARND